MLIVVALISVALFFDYINGFHDAANSIATVVSTRVLTPGKAVIWAAFFNFVAAFTFGTAVATTIGAGMIDRNVVTLAVTRLFDDERDPILIMKWKETLDFLEDATDRCEDVANVLEGVVVKHG